MMQTHREIFIKVLVVTIIIGIILFIPFECKAIKDICLALFGSAVIATFLEFVNYLSAKRQLIMQLIADNTIISNAICDVTWFYRTCTDYKKKLDELLWLYKIIQSYVFCLSKEAYTPFIGKGKLIKTLEKNVNVVNDIYDLSLKVQRTIVGFRNSKGLLQFEGKVPQNLDQMLDKLPSDLICNQVDALSECESALIKCTNVYKEKYKLHGCRKARDHYDVLDEIISDLEKNRECKCED